MTGILVVSSVYVKEGRVAHRAPRESRAGHGTAGRGNGVVRVD